MFLYEPLRCRTEPSFFVAPRRLLGDAVPKEVRDASLSLGRTIKKTLGRIK
jgi:ABC-type phosphate transport system permease subunit